MTSFKKVFFLVELSSIIFLIEIVSIGIAQDYDLPPFGLTTCSQYPRTTTSRSNSLFSQNKYCYIQYMFQGPARQLPFKCAYATITDGDAPALQELFNNAPTRLASLTSKGQSTVTIYVDKVNPVTNETQCRPKTNKYTYAEYKAGIAFTFSTKRNPTTGEIDVDKTLISTMVMANDNGYGLISCVLDFKDQTKCSTIHAAFACTFQKNPPNAATYEFALKFAEFPFYNAAYFMKVNQTDCAGCRPN